MIAAARRLPCWALVGLLILLGAPVATANAAGDDWLGEVNRYRLASGLDPVADQPAWSGPLLAHLTYLANTPASYRTGDYASDHTENPASPYYTADGNQAGSSSNLESGGRDNPVAAIDDWLKAPFHAIGILRPQLTQVAFALDPTTGAAALDIIHGLDWNHADPGAPILFPGPGMTTDLQTFDGENPDPTETCGWQGQRVGLPLIALLPSAPSTSLTADLAQADGPTQSTTSGELCVVDEHTFATSDGVYGPAGRAILHDDHAVLLIPHHPFSNATYTATIHQAEQADIAWSFSTYAPPTITPPNGAAPTAAGQNSDDASDAVIAHASHRPPAPSRPGYRHGADGIIVYWYRVRGAHRYEASISVGHRTRHLTVSRPRFTLRLPDRRSARVSVASIAANGRLSRRSPTITLRG